MPAAREIAPESRARHGACSGGAHEHAHVTFGCVGGGQAGFDYGACDTAMKSATCIDASGGKSVLLPQACHFN